MRRATPTIRSYSDRSRSITRSAKRRRRKPAICRRSTWSRAARVAAWRGGAGNFGGNFGGGFGSGANTPSPGPPALAAELGNLGSSYTNSTIGVQVTIPLFAGGATQSRVRQTLALEDQAAADLATGQ
ncbi:TolC family protein [Paraburkholderia kirstenboschensis]|uniref:TolC family protein n=1 Tax=Paraburkholderia kirstenboschensis TaxID=1245436 RepID=UPI000FFC4DA5|nr:TolC family protein [Paraburkholderia kirstenboschensis]